MIEWKYKLSNTKQESCLSPKKVEFEVCGVR